MILLAAAAAAITTLLHYDWTIPVTTLLVLFSLIVISYSY